MKVVLFNGSPRKNGNTSFCLNVVKNELESEGIECEIRGGYQELIKKQDNNCC